MYIDTEELLVNYLQSISPGNVAAEMPNQPNMPFILVARASGGDDKVTDFAIVEISVFHTSRVLASAAARLMHTKMLALRPTTVGLVVAGSPVRIDRCSTIHGPAWMDYQNENLRRYTARYVVESRVDSQNP